MDIITTSKNNSRNDNLHLIMDYDSGYMSHNPESNLDSSLETSDENLLKTDDSKPVYLSEDALLETPITNKYPHSNIRMEIENEDYEETRKLFNMIDFDESALPSSISSRGSPFIGFSESSTSDVSLEISPAKPLIFNSEVENNRKSLMCKLPLALLKDTPILGKLEKINSDKVSSPQLNNFSGLLECNKNLSPKPSLICSVPLETIKKMDDPKKKLTLVFSKANENNYSVKRKYPSTSPNKNEIMQNNIENNTSGQQSDLEANTSGEYSSLETTQESPSLDESYLLEKSACDSNQQDVKPLRTDEFSDISSVLEENQPMDISQSDVLNIQCSVIDSVADDQEIHGSCGLPLVEETTETDQIKDITESKQIPMPPVSEVGRILESSVEEESLSIQLQAALQQSAIRDMDSNELSAAKVEQSQSCTEQQVEEKPGINLNGSIDVQTQDSTQQVSFEVQDSSEYIHMQLVVTELDYTTSITNNLEQFNNVPKIVEESSLVTDLPTQQEDHIALCEQKSEVNEPVMVSQIDEISKVDTAKEIYLDGRETLLEPTVETDQQVSSISDISQLNAGTQNPVPGDRISVIESTVSIEASTVENSHEMKYRSDHNIEMLEVSVGSISTEGMVSSQNLLPGCSTKATRIGQNSFSRKQFLSQLESSIKDSPVLCDVSMTGASCTPKKSYVNKVNPDVSPDLFSDEEAVVEPVLATSQQQNYMAKEQYIMRKDERILRRTQNSLKGVLPPRSITVCQISVNEILNRLETNKEYYWNNTMTTNCGDGRDESTLNLSGESSLPGESKSLLINSLLDEARSADFPAILKLRNHGLYHNRSKLSEELEELCVKFGERYVGAETQSSCTVFEANCPSPKKRVGGAAKPRWSAKSPGRRLSHLARRRITFSSATLQAGGSSSASFAGVRARQILVDAKKLDMLNIRRSPRKTPKKTPSKSPLKRTRTPSSSAKKKLALRFRRLAGEIECAEGPSSQSDKQRMMPSKRALFSSPEKKKENTIFSQTSTYGLSSISRSPFKRLDIGFDKKRKRDEELDDTCQPSKIARSMSMDVKKMDVSQSLCRTKSDGILSMKAPPQDLSAAHKKKLQWAVYEALRAHNVGPTHENFKAFASVLARVIRRLICHMNSAASGPLGGSTSERMLRFARRHVLAVIKGASVEEIISEYTKMQLKQRKPQGYIGIEEFNAARDKENQIQDRTRGLESLEKTRLEELHKPKLGGDNRIERIRKVINFGDDDR